MVQKWHFIYLFDIFVPMMDSKRYWILALVILLRPLITTSFTRGLRNHGSCFHLAHLPHRMPTCKEQLVFDNNFIENDVPTARLEALPRLLNDDMRVNRSSLMPPSTDDTMKIFFLGTASCMPGMTRGVSCTVLRRQLETLVFDVGEGTQKRIMQSGLNARKISRIFITHAHGDHCFGLVGLLCTIGMAKLDERGGPAVDIYGPRGLRNYLRVATQFTVSRIVAPYRVHEMMPAVKGQRFNKELSSDASFGELPGGRDIYPDKDGSYLLIDELNGVGLQTAPPPELMELIKYDDEIDDSEEKVVEAGDVGQHVSSTERSSTPLLTVRAAPMVHKIACVGFVVEEKDRVGKLNIDLVKSYIDRNFEALQKEHNISRPKALAAHIKKLRPFEKMVFPDGSHLFGRDAVGPAIPGRKVVICGDTSDASMITDLAMDCDVLVHEATNTYLVGRDKTDLERITRLSVKHGHSTPFMAGSFAKRIRAKRLVLNHFSGRYSGDDRAKSVLVMLRIEAQAGHASGLSEDKVHAAWDLSSFSIHHPQTRE